jgi:hypothetical protein
VARAADADGRLAGPAEAAIDLLALGSALARLVPLKEVGADAAATAGPVAEALVSVRDGLEDPRVVALELERAAEALERASTPEGGERAAPGAERLRDAARIVRREAQRRAG